MHKAKKYQVLVWLTASLLTLAACGKKENHYGNPPVITPPVTVPDTGTLVKLPSQWTKQTTLTNGFTAGIEVYRNTAVFNGITLNAYTLVFDPKNTGIEWKPILAAKNKTPGAVYNEEPGVKYACINGGYFGTNVSYSLVVNNATILAPNIKTLVRSYNGSDVNYYPTRGAFGITASGIPEVTWMYNAGSANELMYSYTQPAANKEGIAPLPMPNAAGAVAWNVLNAIGGSPVLIKNGVVKITDAEELIVVDNAIQRARTAIGYNADGKVLILVVEGGNPTGAKGLNLQDLADLLKSMGCTNALNLDGGGSTDMVVNGQLTVKPSDAAGERPVMSMLLLKKKQ